MKQVIRNLIISIIAYSGVAFVYRWYVRRRGPLVRVLCFHDVPDKVWFTDIVGMLVKRYNVLIPHEFHSGQWHDDRINILLTFDDGYQSWVDVCRPVMEHYGVKGIFFINSGLLDCAHDSEAIKSYMHDRLLLRTVRQPLTWEGAKQLVGAGHTIGGHTITHSNLALLQATELEKEIVKDKKRIEEMLGITLRDFAYPFGTKKHFTKEVIHSGNAAGYSYQYSAISGFVPREGKNAIPRTLIEKNQPIPLVRRWMLGPYDILNILRFF